jgi:hypothetical protein
MQFRAPPAPPDPGQVGNRAGKDRRPKAAMAARSSTAISFSLRNTPATVVARVVPIALIAASHSRRAPFSATSSTDGRRGRGRGSRLRFVERVVSTRVRLLRGLQAIPCGNDGVGFPAVTLFREMKQHRRYGKPFGARKNNPKPCDAVERRCANARGVLSTSARVLYLCVVRIPPPLFGTIKEKS